VHIVAEAAAHDRFVRVLAGVLAVIFLGRRGQISQRIGAVTPRQLEVVGRILFGVLGRDAGGECARPMRTSATPSRTSSAQSSPRSLASPKRL